jgi:hypothetical protein
VRSGRTLILKAFDLKDIVFTTPLTGVHNINNKQYKSKSFAFDLDLLTDTL